MASEEGGIAVEGYGGECNFSDRTSLEGKLIPYFVEKLIGAEDRDRERNNLELEGLSYESCGKNALGDKFPTLLWCFSICLLSRKE